MPVSRVNYSLKWLQSIATLQHHQMFTRSLELLSSQQSMRIVFNALEGSHALCLLANLVQMAHLERHSTLPGLCFPTFTVSRPVRARPCPG